MDNVSLDAAYPNPFSQIINIKVNIPATQHVSVKVYDILGHEVATLADENLSQGVHSFYWDGNSKNGSSLGNGLYLIRLQTEKQSLARSIVLTRNSN
jgi:flagellar hook assembly protein FlgD